MRKTNMTYCPEISSAFGILLTPVKGAVFLTLIRQFRFQWIAVHQSRQQFWSLVEQF